MTPQRPARVIVLAVVMVAGLLAVAPRAQEPALQQPTFRTAIDSVSVDVIVTDKQGKPVTDLTKDDFEIKEAGKTQVVDAFKFIKIADDVDEQLEGRQILSFADQASETAREDTRLFAIYLDDYHVRRGNSMVVREKIAQFVAQLTPHDLVAVVTPSSTISALTFSRDHLVTANIIREFVGRKYDYTVKTPIDQRIELLPPEAQEQVRNDIVVGTLRNLCEELGGMREGRKTVLYVSEGMSGSIPAGVRTRGNPTPGRPGNAPTLPNEDSRTFFDTASLINEMQVMFTAASRNNVAIYTIDPRGLGVFEFGVEEDVTQANDRRILTEAMDSLRTIAGETDGRAILNRNDPMPALKQMVTDGSVYYLLGYTSTLAPRDGKFHEIQVRVKRPNVEVRARKGYWAYTAEDAARAAAKPKASPPEGVSTAIGEMTAVADGSRSRVVSSWMGAVRGTGEKATVTFVWEPTAATPADPEDAVDHVTIVANAITGDEVYRGPIAKDPLSARNGGRVTFDAPAGAVRVRLTAENAKGQRLDTDDTTLDVPDFTGTGPMLATPFVYRGRTARDIQLIKGGSAAVPAVRRVFSRSERLLIRLGAYAPGGGTPTLTMRLLNQEGGTIASLPAPAPAASTPGVVESEIGLSSIPPGDYVIEIDGESAGQTTKQFLAIRVTG